MALSPGTKLGPYEIAAPLGAGGMGEVYRARDSRLGRDVALKILPAEVGNDASRRQRFELEARAVAALSHPNIVAVHDVGTANGVFYIVSELVDGESLRSVQFSQRKTLDIAVQIASGLAAAHAAGIIHRDLKPDNILLTRDGRVKILDFGLAKLTPTQSPSHAGADTMTMNASPGMVMGTVGYMSPEQVRGLDVDNRSDIFSFGVILHELLTGKRAFHGETSVETMTDTAKEHLPPVVLSSTRR
jgi:eukaryotic-like serine/threonine-protein kinase